VSGGAGQRALWVPPGSERDEALAARREARIREERTQGWHAVVSAALRDEDLAVAVESVTTPVGGLDRPCVPLARAQLLAWAITVQRSEPDVPLEAALRAALAAGRYAAPAEALAAIPPPPPASLAADDLARRLAALLEIPSKDSGQRATAAARRSTGGPRRARRREYAETPTEQRLDVIARLLPEALQRNVELQALLGELLNERRTDPRSLNDGDSGLEPGVER
jgi:hypothetical protein